MKCLITRNIKDISVYPRLSKRSYGEEEDILNWEILMDCYDVVLSKGIIFREKEERNRYDTRRRSGSYLDATGLSVVAMKVAEKWGRVFHIGFHVLLCTQRLQARFYTFYVMF